MLVSKMGLKLLVLEFLFSLTVFSVYGTSEINSESCHGGECEAKRYLADAYETEVSKLYQKAMEADWEYNMDLENEEKEKALADANIAHANFKFKSWNETFRFYDYNSFKDPLVKRQLKFLNYVGVSTLNQTDLARYNEILAQMTKVYGTAKICPFENQKCNLTSETLDLDDIEKIMLESRDSEKLSYVWKAWRDSAGKPIREIYKEFVTLSNKAALANGVKDNGDLWLVDYEVDNFKEQVKEVWETVRELYVHLYAYVRYRLREVYPEEFKEPNHPIPAHLLGTIMGETWDSIYTLVIPFPNSTGFDVNEKLKKHFTSQEKPEFSMFETANKFYMNLGLDDMSVAYNDKAMIVKPKDGRQVSCHASAWDFSDKTNFRISMCTEINQIDFITIHHELGHIQYYMNYRNQPITFRSSANAGFHEAIGDVLSLSVANPKHMYKLGFFDSTNLTHEVTINFLMQKALADIAFLPFGYLIDAYRWKLFDGSIPYDKMQYEWIKIRNEIQGLIPPTMRSEMDFDGGALFHVSSNTPYIRYFVSSIITYQIYEALCKTARQYVQNHAEKPLYNCDFDGNRQTGDIIRKLLEKGSSEIWQDVLEEATGSRVMDGNSIKEYYSPLIKFFKEKQAEINYPIDWKLDAFKGLYEGDEQSSSDKTKQRSPSWKTFETSASETSGGFKFSVNLIALLFISSAVTLIRWSDLLI